MSIFKDLKTWLIGGILVVANYVGALSSVVAPLDPVITFLVSTAGTWYPLAAIFGRLGSSSGLIPSGIGIKILLLGSGVYGLILAERFLSRGVGWLRKQQQ